LKNIVYDNIFLSKKQAFYNKKEREKVGFFLFLTSKDEIFFILKKAVNEEIRLISFLKNSCVSGDKK
jgi:hypothetical protein